MSSYLLLRSNQESGPFSLEEIKNMPLKAYDLVWVVGKSAAWRYPGELPELKTFAPPVPEQEIDPQDKRPNSDGPIQENNNTQKQEIIRARTAETNLQRRDSGRAVYVNLPADRKQPSLSPVPHSDNSIFPAADKPEPHYDFSDLNKKKSDRAVRISGKLVRFGTIMLLFSAGILTGLVISDRRKIFSSDENRPQKNLPVQRTQGSSKKELLNNTSANNTSDPLQKTGSIISDSARAADQNIKKINAVARKKNSKNSQDKKDSAASQTVITPSFNLIDSIKQNATAKSEMLSQKIKAHPENYVSLTTGRYSTGIFGGISSFPLTVTNNSEVRMDLVIINVDYIQNNEKIFKTESITLNDLEPGEAITIKAPKSSRGVKIATRIHILNSRQIDLSYSN
jgi:hypothetical protein